MKKLKTIINGYMYRITSILIVVVLIMLALVQILTEQRRSYEESKRNISQIEILLEENQQELETIQEQYKQTCLYNAELVAKIIEGDPEILEDIEKLRYIAKAVEIDEIHIFDITGRLIKGTNPEYYNMTFDSGEQISFFKPMLSDKNLKLVQEITPNTSAGKPIQYAAVWSEHKEFIVQVGIEPVNVMKVTEKNELSYIFSIFRVSQEASYYAINAETGEIVGSTEMDALGVNAEEIGFDMKTVKGDSDGFHMKINDKLSFCVFQKSGDNYIGCVVEADVLYERVPVTVLWSFISLIVVTVLLATSVVLYMNRFVVSKIGEVNDKLKSIADGNLDESVEIESSLEFAELSKYVNSMVKSLVDNNKKMSYALSKTNMHIGTYEYGCNTLKVNYTEYTPKILGLEPEQMEKLATKQMEFVKFLDGLKKNPLSGEYGIYIIADRYIKLEEISESGSVFGVAIDVTNEINKRLKIEKERDIDTLTGLYNRRGLDARITKLFEHPNTLGHSAIMMVDADGLKGINDTYGHEKGDIYLQNIAKILSSVGAKEQLAARQGGDEFVLFLYGYEDEKLLMEDIDKLKGMQSGITSELSEGLEVNVRFSLGYSIVDSTGDFQELLKEADEKMYQNKTERKKKFNN